MRKYIYAITTCLFLAGCAVNTPVPRVKNGKTYGWVTDGHEIFRETWFDYYRCAVSYMDGGFYAEAVDSLEKSMKAAKTRAVDSRMAMTYGMHFTGYFPHREKGISHYFLKQYQEAKTELELSISQEPSDKAFFYLDQTRIQLMKQAQAEATPPRLNVSFPKASEPEGRILWTNADPISIKIIAEDSQYVSAVTINERNVFMENSVTSFDRTEPLSLEEGRHTISVFAENLLNGKTRQAFDIRVDRSAPVMTLHSFVPGSHIRGYLYDESGDIRLLVDEKEIAVPKGKDAAFVIPSGLSFPGVRLTAVDRAGNETSMQIGGNAVALSSSYLAFTPLLGITDVSSMLVAAASSAPDIHLDDWHERDTVFKEKISMGITVSAGSTIRDIWVNNRPVPGRKGSVVSFVHNMSLKPGPNSISIRTEDINGKTAEKTVLITRKIPEALQMQHRYGFTMKRFETSEEYKSGALLYKLFVNHLVNKKRFRIRLDEELDTLLPPPAYAGSEFNNSGLLLGMIQKTALGIEVSARLVDIETDRIMAITDAYEENTGAGASKNLSMKLSEKLHRRVPMMDGAITDASDGEICIMPKSWTPEESRLMEGWPMVVYKKTGDHPATHGSDMDVIRGEARMKEMGASGAARAGLYGCPLTESETYRVLTR